MIARLVVVDVKMLFEVAAKIVALMASVESEFALVNSAVLPRVVSVDTFDTSRPEAVDVGREVD